MSRRRPSADLITRTQRIQDKAIVGEEHADWQPAGSLTPYGASPAMVSHRRCQSADVLPTMLAFMGIDAQHQALVKRSAPHSPLAQYRYALCWAGGLSVFAEGS